MDCAKDVHATNAATNHGFEVSTFSVRTQTSWQSICPVTIKYLVSRGTLRPNMSDPVAIDSQPQRSRRTMSSPTLVRFVLTL